MIAIGSKEYGVWLVTSQPATAQAVRSALELHERLTPAGVCTDLVSLSGQLERTAVAVAVVDIDPQPRRLLGELEPLINRYAHTRFVVLSEQPSADLMREAMQIGARQFVPKNAIATDLSVVLQRLISSNGHARALKQGTILTVLSSGGGCGATTLAVNLANELRLRQATSTLLVDLDGHYGGVSRYLGLNGQYSIADVLSYSGRIDGQLISSTALPYDDHLHALLNPVSANFARPKPLAYDQFDQLLEGCGQHYDWTVLDAPRLAAEAVAPIVARSQLMLIVSQLSVKDLRAARELWMTLIDHGAPADAIHHVINRYRKRGSAITLDDARQALDSHATIHLVENDYRAANDSMNLGRPLAQSAPRSTLRRSIQDLANVVAQTLSATEKATAAR